MKKILQLATFLLFATQSFAQYQIGHRAMSANDANRSNRNVTFDVYYPATTAGNNVAIAPGEFPVVVFGHGFSIAYTEYKVWWDSIAPKGYIIVFPTTESGGLFDSSNHPNFAGDISFLVDEFFAQNNDTSSPFYQSVSDKSAVMGHSMGGGCVWTAGLNPNVTTMITMGAVETNGVSAIGNAALMTIPTLTLAGTEDCVATSSMSAGGPFDIYDAHSVDPYHAFVDIYGGSHCQFGIASFGSVCTLGEFGCGGFMGKAAQHEQMTLSALPWLDYFLKDDCDAWFKFREHAETGNTVLHDFIERGNLPKTVSLATKMMLEGPYDAGLMLDDLRLDLPTSEPFSSLGFQYINFEGEEVTDPNVFAVTGNDAIVDWGLVELRDKNDATIVVATKAALLQRDGDLVDVDGVSTLNIFCVEPDDYFVAVQTRNHLGLMTATALPLGSATTSIDFTATSTAVMGGNQARKLDNGVELLWTGDTNFSGIVDAADRSNTWNDRNLMGYVVSDLTMDGVCNAADRSAAWNNRNRESFIP